MTRCIALCIPLLWGTAASAADSPIVAVVGLHQDGVHLDAQEKLSRSLISAINKTGRARAVPGADIDLAGRQRSILEEALLTTGRQQLAEGRNFYNQAEPQQAIVVLERAIDSLQTGAVISGDFRDLWDAWVFLGTAHVALEARAEAETAFRNAVAINQSRSPDPALFPPDVTELFEEVRTQSRARSTSLTVTSTGPAESLEVHVDGESAGNVPATLPDLVPGRHHIRALGDGKMGFTTLEFEGAMAIEIDLDEPTLGSGASSLAGRSRDAESLYRALGRQTPVDYVLLAGTEGNLLNLQLYDVGADIFSTPTSTPYSGRADDEAEAAVTLLVKLLERDGGLSDAATQAGAIPLERQHNPLLASMLLEPIDPNGPPRRSRRGMWTGVGVGLAVVVTAAAVGGTIYAVNTSPPKYRGRVRIGSF